MNENITSFMGLNWIFLYLKDLISEAQTEDEVGIPRRKKEEQPGMASKITRILHGYGTYTGPLFVLTTITRYLYQSTALFLAGTGAAAFYISGFASNAKSAVRFSCPCEIQHVFTHLPL